MALLTLDLVFRGPLLHPVNDLRFSRVGFVDDTSARVLFREPDPAQLPVYVYLKDSQDSKWTTTDRIYYIDSATDYTSPLLFTGLSPETAYTYSLSNDLSGTFKTAPAPSSQQANSLTFLTSSCIKANFPYNPFSHALDIHGFEHLSKIVKSLTSPASFMLFLGDFGRSSRLLRQPLPNTSQYTSTSHSACPQPSTTTAPNTAASTPRHPGPYQAYPPFPGYTHSTTTRSPTTGPAATKPSLFPPPPTRSSTTTSPSTHPSLHPPPNPPTQPISNSPAALQSSSCSTLAAIALIRNPHPRLSLTNRCMAVPPSQPQTHPPQRMTTRCSAKSSSPPS